jgi:uncharacterized protein
MIKKLVLSLYLISLGILVLAQEIPTLTKRVNDNAELLSQAEEAELESMLAGLESRKGSQVVVLIIPTTGEYAIEQYSIELAEKWKIGREGTDDGVILVLAVEDRKVRIEVGYGLEGALTDALSKRIIENVIVPDFRAGNYYSGIKNGLGIIISVIEGEELPPIVQESTSNESDSGFWMVFGFIMAIIAIQILAFILKKVLGEGKSKLIIFLSVFIVGWFFANFIIGIIIGVVTLAFSSSGVGRSSGGTYYGGGFSSGGGGFSSGGGGGFSGGGGSFGGGGASGGW